HGPALLRPSRPGQDRCCAIPEARDPRMKRQIRSLFKCAWAFLLYYSGAIAWARRQLGRNGGVVVLTLHRVLNEQDLAESCRLPGMVLRDHMFDALLGSLKPVAEVVSLDAAAPGLPTRRPRVVLTFDDGWLDTYTTALPIARRHGVPFTVFISTRLIGRHAPFFPQRLGAVAATPDGASWIAGILGLPPDANVAAAIEHLKTLSGDDRAAALDTIFARFGGDCPMPGRPDATMTWAQARACHDAGITIGSHTQSHEYIATVSPEIAARELN